MLHRPWGLSRFVKVARSERFPFSVRRHRLCQKHARTAGKDGRPKVRRAAWRKRIFEGKAQRTATSETGCPVTRCSSFLAFSFSLLTSPPPSFPAGHHSLADEANAPGWSLVLAICRNRHSTDSLLHHHAPESKVLSEARQPDRRRRKQPGGHNVVFSWFFVLFLFFLLLFCQGRDCVGSRGIGWFLVSLLLLHTRLRAACGL